MEYLIKNLTNLNDIQINKFYYLKKIYTYINRKINIISYNTLNLFYRIHILHSLAIAKLITILPTSKILDLGTGGGFPGIPLSIYFPKSSFVLVDSIKKKINVVNYIIQYLNLQNVKTYCIRAEKLNDKFDFIVSKSVHNLFTIYQWTKKNIYSSSRHKKLSNGMFCLKGGNIFNQLKYFNNSIEFPLSNYFKLSYFCDKKIIYIPYNQ